MSRLLQFLAFIGGFSPALIASGTPVFRHAYDGPRRVQDVEKRPYEPFEPCEFFEFSVKGQLVLAAEDPELQWLNAAGTPIEPIDPCELEPSHSHSGSTYETWCEREYVYGPDQLDELVLQIDRTDKPYYILHDASHNVFVVYGGLLCSHPVSVRRLPLGPKGQFDWN